MPSLIKATGSGGVGRAGARFPTVTLLLLAFSLLFISCGDDGAVEPAGPAAGGEPANTAGISAVRAFPALSFEAPVFLTQVPGDADLLAVVEQEGRILTFRNEDGVSEAGVMLDIRELVNSGGEEGLLGLAFDPGFADNGTFYVYYSAAEPRRTVLSRFSSSSGVAPQADAGSEEVLLEVEQPYANHNGGTVIFGPDGYLYLGLGDGGGGGDPMGNAQDLSTLLGSIIRIDVGGDDGYSIPEDNPFVNRAGARGEIWAYGFRNPYRFSFDSSTGELWAGDVGQSDREEVDLVVKGGNYGWNLFEGSREYRNPEGLSPGDFEAPVVDYGRDAGLSVIGGYVYRGSEFPAIDGIYFYGDYGSGNIWALSYADDELLANELVANVPAISSFGESGGGELFVVSLDGAIYRLVAD